MSIKVSDFFKMHDCECIDVDRAQINLIIQFAEILTLL